MGYIHIDEYCDDCDERINTTRQADTSLRRTCECVIEKGTSIRRHVAFVETPESRDALTKLVTGQPDFETFVKNGLQTPPYQPTFCGQKEHHREEKERLANAFDLEMRKAGSSNRAHRCHW